MTITNFPSHRVFKGFMSSLLFSLLFFLVFTLVFAFAPIYAEASVNTPVCVFNTIVQPFNNGGTTLSWRVYDASSVAITGIGAVSDADALVVYPNTTTTYTLTAIGNGGIDTCSVTVLPTTAYSFNTTNIWNTYPNNQLCSLWVNPDLVVTGGTGVLSWDAGGASSASIDHGIGNVSNRSSRTIANIGFPQTFTMTAKWGNGVVKNCRATMTPVGFATAGAGIAVPTYYEQPTPTPFVSSSYIALNQVPYTGTEGIFYVLGLLGVVLVTFGGAYMLYTRRLSRHS